MKKFIFAFALLILVFGCFRNENIEVSSPPSIIPDIEPIQNSNIKYLVTDEDAYNIGYEEGKRAFFVQNNLDFSSSFAEQKGEYVVLREDSEDSKEDIRMKGYVEGYHKASESIMCPVRSYY